MNLSKWKPWNWFKQEDKESRPPSVRHENNDNVLPVLRLQHDMDRLFENFFERFGSFPSLAKELPQLRMPRLDISETEKSYVIEADVPGMTAEDIDITVKEGILRIRGERRKEESSEDKHEHRTERVYGMFERVLSLPHDANDSEIKAEFKNGVLRLNVSKLETQEAEDNGRKIAVTSG